MTAPSPSPASGFYSASHLEPQDSVGYLMRKVLSSIRTQADAQLSTHDLTYAQWVPLYKIARSGQATVASLARDLETDPAAMTRVLDRLEAGEEVRSTRGPVVRGFRAASRTISGIDEDGLVDAGGAADELMLANLRAADERGVGPADGGR